jgi:hypothetical protein
MQTTSMIPNRSEAMTATPAPSAPARHARRATGSVSVVVPCFNYGHFLDGCVRSVLDQEGVEVRVLVIDDCSTDDSADVAERICTGEARVELRRHQHNAGLIATANEGLEWANGDYVVLLSADDLLVPGALCRAASIMDRHPGVGLVYGRPLLAREGQPLPEYSGRWRSTHVWPGEAWIRTRCKRAHNAMSSPEVVVRNSIQQLVGGYDRECYHTSDFNMWLRIAAVSDVAHVRGVPQAIYRIHSDSMLRSQGGPLADLRERRIAFDSFLRGSGPSLARPDELATIARRTLAKDALWRASRAAERGLPAEQPLIAELASFALDVYPEARRLSEWDGLRLRRHLGPCRSRAFPPFIASRARRRLSYEANRVRWRYCGS